MWHSVTALPLSRPHPHSYLLTSSLCSLLLLRLTCAVWCVGAGECVCGVCLPVVCHLIATPFPACYYSSLISAFHVTFQCVSPNCVTAILTSLPTPTLVMRTACCDSAASRLPCLSASTRTRACPHPHPHALSLTTTITLNSPHPDIHTNSFTPLAGRIRRVSRSHQGRPVPVLS